MSYDNGFIIAGAMIVLGIAGIAAYMWATIHEANREANAERAKLNSVEHWEKKLIAGNLMMIEAESHLRRLTKEKS